MGEPWEIGVGNTFLLEIIDDEEDMVQSFHGRGSSGFDSEGFEVLGLLAPRSAKSEQKWRM